MNAPKHPVLTDTGERIEGLPVCRLGHPALWAARERRKKAVIALGAEASWGRPVTQAMLDEAYVATCEVFRLDGRRAPRYLHATPIDPRKAARDALVRDLLRHTLAEVAEDAGGWASYRFEAINRFDWELAEADERHRPFLWACYRARLEKHGKPATFRPRRPA